MIEIKQNTDTRLIRIFALRRSGQHGIIHWICSQLTGQTAFCNNYRTSCCDGIQFYPNIKQPVDNVVVNFEDKKINAVNNIIPFITTEKQDVIIIRNPFNLLASRWKTEERKTKIVRRASDGLKLGSDWRGGHKDILLWENHVNEALRITENLFNPIVIIFDEWVNCEYYKKLIAKQLKLHYEQHISGTSSYGGGSSFENDPTIIPSVKDVVQRYNLVPAEPLKHINAHMRGLYASLCNKFSITTSLAYPLSIKMI